MAKAYADQADPEHSQVFMCTAHCADAVFQELALKESSMNDLFMPLHCWELLVKLFFLVYNDHSIILILISILIYLILNPLIANTASVGASVFLQVHCVDLSVIRLRHFHRFNVGWNSHNHRFCPRRKGKKWTTKVRACF